MADPIALQIVRSARQMLDFARQGEEDFRSGGSRQLLGLYSAITSGRSVTFVLQNMRHKVDGFDEWYAGHSERLKDDPVAKWFVKLRNQIEKQGNHGDSSTKLRIGYFDSSQHEKPPGTVGFWIGDHLGRSAWQVELADGSIVDVYFQIPDSVVSMHIADAPDARPVHELLGYWLGMLEEIVTDAEHQFSS